VRNFFIWTKNTIKIK